MAFTKIVAPGINSTGTFVLANTVIHSGGVDSHNIHLTGVITATGGVGGIGIYSGGTSIYTGAIQRLNFIGAGNTFSVNGTQIDIAIRGGTSGIGIGSTTVNPQSGTITNRVGTGFTDINFVGTGLSVTGYGSTIVVQIPSAESKTYYNYFEISTSSSTYGQLSHKYIQSDDNETVDLADVDQISAFLTANTITPSIDSNGNLVIVI